MNRSLIQEILQDWMAQSIEVEGIGLVSAQGRPLSPPLGFDEKNFTILVGNVLYSAQNIQKELNWQEFEQIWMSSCQGHVILTPCYPNIFLLVKAGQTLSGFLEGKIDRLIKQLQGAFTVIHEEENFLETLSIFSEESPVSASHIFDKLGKESSLRTATPVQYRGRPAEL
jgi:predicted regulator of Ras-like GTPase activity (Roadblock/LC7/MglB family)